MLMALAVMFMVAACSRQENIQVLTKEITYDVVINNQKVICEEGSEGASYTWFFSNIEASKRCRFLEDLFDKAISDTLNKDTLKITDDDGNKMTVEHYKQRLIVYDSVKFYPPYLVCDTLIKSKIGPNDVFTLRFREKWTYNPETMEIKKLIYAYAPLYYPNDPARPGKRVSKPVPLFWMQQDTNAACSVLFTEKILSTIPYNDPPDFINPDSAKLAEYMNDLNRYVFNDSLPAYIWCQKPYNDFKTHDYVWRARLTPTKNQKTIDSIVPGIFWQVFCGLENVNKADTLYEQAVKAGLHFGPAEGICFVEEWYFDPVSLQLAKKVDQIGPVALKRNYKGDIKDFVPSYIVKFNALPVKAKVKKVQKPKEEKKE